ncbi:actin-like ATPase domain-containing protein [Aureobasidium pullulans]|uniref:Actin-like ATPase domain-containing protein n=1 Tax=Aureobasidium pullulans TaxID=5580 RepID=A0A4S9NR08_AURPU|nr:actin-like ATPase domain-containing protein [Aureobasidium pullulans]THW06945.1 actin-like ATPase domain-containing protein [Aureobasidium pullulans]THW22581.1 actin-like ATPase domain-containing protein [Aureobasidium pullulans]THW27342.1 actin-like ATPase domain-containing protein [Aureobasidium pullulans]THW47792.1 actin-like ATPase domain-containing protein [Aureobasidium pullulans]
MAPFKDEQILIIAPGSRTTLAQLGLPESLTPARFRIRSCMFPAEKPGEFEPNKVRRKDAPPADGDSEPEYEEDVLSEQGAVWPIQQGRIVDWDCFFALVDHVYRNINPPFHTAVLLIAQPTWTPKEHEKIAQFIFEKLKPPAFGLMDAASATLYAYGVSTATIVDVGYEKADVTAISDYLVHDTGRALSVPSCGGEAMTERLFQLLASRGFSKEVCEQLKKNPICEILPPDVELPSENAPASADQPSNPAAAASTGAEGSGPGQRTTTAALGETPLGPGPGTQVGSEQQDGEDNEGVLDIASIVTGGNMTEFLERKEKEKAERLAAKKKGTEAGSAGAKPAKLPNSKRLKNTFVYEDHNLRDAMKQQNYSDKQIADMQAAVDVGTAKKSDADAGDGDRLVSDGAQDDLHAHGGAIRREAEVGIERFQAATGGILDRLADVIYRTVSSVEEVGKRSELWDSLIIVGNGSKVRGFKEALLTTLQTKYLISPSSATIFTSELPSNLSTPMATGANTPQPTLPPHLGSGVNPLLYAATTAQNPQLNPMSGGMPSGNMPHSLHTSHAQSPTSVKFAKMPEYFPEWKDAGYEEAVFLGAQVAAKVLFMADQGLNKGYMTRTDYNEQGPQGIHDCSM